MNVLIACEYSGIVRDAFISRGHNVISCDLLDSDAPGPHHKGDIVEYLKRFKDNHFDLIIAHPECTKLCVSGNAHYGEGQKKYHLRLESVVWTVALWELCKKKAKAVCLENPVSVLHRLGGLPKASYVQPYGFGHLEQKKTGFHLYNLNPLEDENNVFSEMMELPKNIRERLHYLSPSKDRWKIRSTTFKGIAEAMANQWSNKINYK